MPPQAYFLTATAHSVHIVFKPRLPGRSGRAGAADPYTDPANYQLADAANPTVKGWPGAAPVIARDAEHGAAVTVKLDDKHAGLDQGVTYLLTIVNTGDVFSAVRVGDIAYPDAKHGPDPETLKELRSATGSLADIKSSIDTASATFNTNVSNALGGVTNAANSAAAVLRNGPVSSLLGFPFLTESVTPRSTSADLLPGPSGGTSLQRTVDTAMRAVLGRPIRADDAKGFQTALSASFLLSDFEGHRVWKYTPRAFAGAAEFGESLTGAQASLVAFGKNALDQALPMIDAVTALNPNAVPEEVEAARAVLRSGFLSFVGELSNTGGPRPLRTDLLLRQITSPDTGFLDNFGVLLGMFLPAGVVTARRITRQFVIQLSDEDDLTKYVSVRDYVSAISGLWANYRTNFFQKDLGTTLVLLSRSLAVVGDQVQDVTDAMDSVYVGVAERQSIRLSLDDPFNTDGGFATQSILLDDLLRWVASFAANEAQELIASSGRRGVVVIRDTAAVLTNGLGQVVNSLSPNPTPGTPTVPGLPPGLRHPRVFLPLQDLLDGLFEVYQNAVQIVADLPGTPGLPLGVGEPSVA